MGRIYSANFTGATLTSATAQDAFSLKASSTTIGMLHAVYLSQFVKAQDANDAQIAYTIKTGATTQGSGGSTPAANSGRDTTTSGTTIHANDTTVANTGTIITPHSDSFNDRAGLVFIPTPEMRNVLVWSPSTCLVVTLAAAGISQTYTSGFSGTIYWEEF